MRRAAALLLLTGCSLPGPPPGGIEGEPFPIAQPWVYAEDNGHFRWSATLMSEQPLPCKLGSDLQLAWVEFGGARHAVTGARQNPGLVLRANFSVAPDPAPRDGPAGARFVLTNPGREPIAFKSRRGAALGCRETELRGLGRARDVRHRLRLAIWGCNDSSQRAPPAGAGARPVLERVPIAGSAALRTWRLISSADRADGAHWLRLQAGR